ncbi:hypothetical protein [Leifsonia sp. TF02-11]|uniref:hypothetical protein n=1 Tax=Leifsonia sp. TF02-11 TaxID=2815212 RepID=UPI001AA16C46|nr:hypothetical protein [Leifsonia sp. TF02-11]MBO1741843.1 hypothetical protein [Leifsonia sp. TF02-11]
MRKLLVGVIATALVLVGGWFAAAYVAPTLTAGASGSSARVPSTPTCPAVSPVTIGTIVVPAGPVAGFCQPELVMAAHIMNAARDQGIGTHTQAVGVMTAIGESGLRNLDYGDAAGPDSRGLFQQRDNGAWGTLADRMDPYTAATHFFDKLTTIDGWQTMDPSTLAHAVQVNADPGYYAQYWDAAQTIVGALSG